MIIIVGSKRSESVKLELTRKRAANKKLLVTTSDKGKHKKLPSKLNVIKLLSKMVAGTYSAHS
jgi:hypothetical protein